MHVHELLESTKKDLHWLFTSDEAYTVCLTILSGLEIRVTTTFGPVVGRFKNIFNADRFRPASLYIDCGRSDTDIDAKDIRSINVVRAADLIRSLLRNLEDDYDFFFKHLKKKDVIRVVKLVCDNNQDVNKVLSYIESHMKDKK